MLPDLPSLPFTDPVLIFALAMVLFLAVPLLFERFRIPGLIGLILVGAAIGENGFGLLARNHTMVLLGTVGLLYLMFLVGLELDLAGARRHKSHTLVFGLLSFALPLGLGTGLALILGYPLRSAALIGAMLSSHTSVGYPIASRLGIVKTQAVTTVLGATLIVDLLALLVLAIVSKASGALDWAFWIGLFVPLTIYVAVVLVLLPRVGKWFFRTASAEGPTEYLFTLAALFIFSYLAHAAGIEPVIGALLTGFALNRLIPEHSALMSRIKFVAEAIFVPFFLLSVGMLINVRALAHPSAWVAIIGFVAVAVVSKGIPALVTTKVFHYGKDDGFVAFGLSVSRAAATIAIALVGYELHVIDEAVVNAIAVMILVTCVAGPWMVARYGRAVALREEQKPYEPNAMPDRILIPISNPKTRDALLDLAFILRGSSPEPLYPLMVVSDDTHTDAGVAEAERMLSHAVLYAAGADIPVHPLTRVDPNIASGIARGIAETRSSTAVIGWDGSRPASRYGIQGIFGTVLDQVLDQTTQRVVVAKLGHQLKITDRVVLFVPPAAIHHPGFSDAAHMIKVLAANLGASLMTLVLDGDGRRVATLMNEIKPTVAITVNKVETWGRVLGELERRLSPNDLVVVMSARRGTVSWHPKLDRLPAQLARLVPKSFLMIYPGVRDPVAAPASPLADGAWPPGLSPARVSTDLVDVPWQAAIRHMIRPSFAHDEDALEEVMESIVRSHDDLSTEIRPGIVVPHARVPGITNPLVFLGVSSAGISFPNTPNRAHIIFTLLSPMGEPQAHLRALADLAHLVASDQRLNELLRLCNVDVVPILTRIGPG